MQIIKRTFEACKYPVGSDERKKLNDSAITSEYMTSYKYQLIGENCSFAYRTRKEAETAKQKMENKQ